MSIISRLAIALAVGLVAAGLNALALSSATKQSGYVALARDVKQGDAVPAAALAELAVPGDPAVVGRSRVAAASPDEGSVARNSSSAPGKVLRRLIWPPRGRPHGPGSRGPAGGRRPRPPSSTRRS